ncbi:hypothetical protein GM661_18675 [Iocasia frigidifontis]|uniref:Uncharacterized protein n=1 Tax=Iocasia fonsfrigidae TaxID=2682810 RepID=A0A8A7KP53_9FIRM|nr:hypothetical protein [Iocasia fonsfrigidae]QTL99834.1 hypothetical protein GM661_18675 [Iocasia fonsfrigidae]
MIQINNYFFEPTKFEKKYREIGNTQRSFSGKVHTQNINKYYNFQLKIEGLSPSMFGNLLYLLSLNRGEDPSNLTLLDNEGNEYTVIIPINGVNYDREEGEEETYYWEMEMWEVI